MVKACARRGDARSIEGSKGWTGLVLRAVQVVRREEEFQARGSWQPAGWRGCGKDTEAEGALEEEKHGRWGRWQGLEARGPISSSQPPAAPPSDANAFTKIDLHLRRD